MPGRPPPGYASTTPGPAGTPRADRPGRARRPRRPPARTASPPPAAGTGPPTTGTGPARSAGRSRGSRAAYGPGTRAPHRPPATVPTGWTAGRRARTAWRPARPADWASAVRGLVGLGRVDVGRWAELVDDVVPLAVALDDAHRGRRRWVRPSDH